MDFKSVRTDFVGKLEGKLMDGRLEDGREVEGKEDDGRDIEGTLELGKLVGEFKPALASWNRYKNVIVILISKNGDSII